MEKDYNTNREYIEDIALSKGIKSLDFKSEDTIVINKNSQTIEELGANKHFWRSLFFEFKDDVLGLGFLYQEKEKELPLSSGKSLVKNLGFKVKPKIQEGEIKKEQVFPNSIRTNSPGFDAINVTVSKDEWEKLNALSKESYGFGAPYVMMPEPLCYQVHIPLENITDVRFKDYNFLNKFPNKD